MVPDPPETPLPALQRVLVAQPPAQSPLDEVTLSVGLHHEDRDSQTGTLVVKLTLGISPGDRPGVATATILSEQEPISPARPSALPGATGGELSRPLDFAARRPRPEVLLTGHAHTAQPAAFVRCSVRVGPFVRSFIAASGVPVIAIPLSAPYLRAEDGRSATSPVGPVRPTAPLQTPAGLFPLRTRQTDAGGDPESTAAPGIPANALVELWGLSRHAPHIAVPLPGLAPRARAVDETEAFEHPIELACDTLLIDTDHDVLVLTWRGDLDLTLLQTGIHDHLLVSLEVDSAPRSLEDLAGARARGRLGWAMEPVDVTPPTTTFAARLAERRRRPEDLRMARFSAWEQARSPRMPLARHVTIAAALAEGAEDRDTIFARHGTTEDEFTFEERAWLEEIANRSMEGDPTLAVAYGELFTEAQDALARPDEATTSLEEYISLRAHMEWEPDPAKFLADRRTSLATWMRLDRRFTSLAEQDPSIAADIERRVTEELEKLGPPPDLDDSPSPS